jgi:hypothetical protein
MLKAFYLVYSSGKSPFAGILSITISVIFINVDLFTCSQKHTIMKTKTSKKLTLDKIKVAKLTGSTSQEKAAAPTITRCSAMGCPSVLAC